MSCGFILKIKPRGFSDVLDVGVSKREEARMMPGFLVQATRRRTMSVWMKETVGEVGFTGGWHQEFCFGCVPPEMLGRCPCVRKAAEYMNLEFRGEVKAQTTVFKAKCRRDQASQVAQW